MSKCWGSDYVVTEHRDLQANAMAVDATGSYVLLAGRRYLAVKQLDEEYDVLRKFPRHSKYEVGSAEWNPTLTNSHLCAISSYMSDVINSSKECVCIYIYPMRNQPLKTKSPNLKAYREHSNTRTEILTFSGSGGQELHTTHTLKGHTRVVSDLNWHPKEPDVIATCSIDTFIHVWDLRDQRKPSLSLSAVAGSSQVRWNPLVSYTLATAHDGDVKIWDQRKGNYPVQYIAAHLMKIHGLDWCPFQQNQIATSSQDCTVKIFDIINPRRAESILTTNSPVWRARYTPFGEALVTIVVPQLRRGENSLLLWNTSNLSAPIYTFVGHTDVVLEFQWRQQKFDNNDYNLITWSKDQCLRIIKIDPFLKKRCGHDMDDSTSVYTQYSEDSNLRLRSVQEIQLKDSQNQSEINCVTSTLDVPVETAEIKSNIDNTKKEMPSPTQPKTLQQEFSLINMNIPNIELNAMDAVERSCTVTAHNKNYNVILKVNFPGNYPYSAQPTFQFCPGTTIDNATMAQLLRVLQQTAQQRVRKNRSCLEPCLRLLITTLEQTCVNDESETSRLDYHIQTNSDFLNSGNMCPNYHDNYIPFPRTSGTKFCSAGILVCFGRSNYARRSSVVKPDGTTPRALSALGTRNSNSGPFNMYPGNYGQSGNTTSISSFYFHDRKSSRRNIHGSGRTQSRNCYKNFYSIVMVYDAAALFFPNKELAEKYIINITDIQAMCQYNANVAASLERSDLVQSWCLAALAILPPSSNTVNSSNCSPDIIPTWPVHPFGRNLLHSLIQHYVGQADTQMAGMLSCVFNNRSDEHGINQRSLVSKSVNASPSGSPYHTIHPADTSLEGWNFQNLKQNRSNSWSESLDNLKMISDTTDDNGRNISMLYEKSTQLYDNYKRSYAEVLHRWQLLDARAQVLKHVTATHLDTHKDVEFQSECHFCSKTSRGPQCTHCKRLAFQCVICHISVRGHSIFCTVCGHGGHTQHLATWFAKETHCPTGCGCSCLEESTSLLRT